MADSNEVLPYLVHARGSLRRAAAHLAVSEQAVTDPGLRTRLRDLRESALRTELAVTICQRDIIKQEEPAA